MTAAHSWAAARPGRAGVPARAAGPAAPVGRAAQHPDPRRRARPRHRHDLVQPAGPDPARRRRRRRRPPAAGSSYFSVLTNPQTWAASSSPSAAVAAGHRGQRRHGHGHRLGAGPRPVLGQARPRRHHRHPVRAADDRRRPGAARRSTARTARSGVRLGQHAERRSSLALAFVTLPFIVRTVQPVLEELEHDVEEAAASLGANRLDDLPPDHPAQPGAGDRGRRGAVVRPGDLASTARWCCSRGNLPFQTEVVSVRVLTLHRERQHRRRRPPLASVMLVVALVVIVALDIIQRRVARRG